MSAGVFAEMGDVKPDYTLSSNPPNPKTSFRLGDWICPSPKCAAHNFGRNLSCIGCGLPRCQPSSSTPASSTCRPSPRFTTTPAPITVPTTTTPTTTYYSSSGLLHPHPSPPSSAPPPTRSSPPLLSANTAAPTNNKPSPHPLLTPSGRAFAVGGKVQNISSDPLNPCIMYWPDNEPFPDPGQIRQSGLVGIPQPPILNTGNRGPISHQPGDWVCQKCSYLNWRRRKVCQTCLPYAEGNGDSISAAVQAERIALLTNVLAQTRLDLNGNVQVPATPVSAAATLHGSAGQSPLQNQLPLSVPQHQAQQQQQSQTPPQNVNLNERSGQTGAFLEVPFPPHLTQHLQRSRTLLSPLVGAHGVSNRTVHRSQSHCALGQQYTQAQAAVGAVTTMQQRHLGVSVGFQRRLAPSPTAHSTPIYQTPLPPPPPPHQQQPQHQHQHQPPPIPLAIQTQLYQQQRPIIQQRTPSPLQPPLLYATGPGGSTTAGTTGSFINGGTGGGRNAAFTEGAGGYGRARVLSSPAGPVFGTTGMGVPRREFGADDGIVLYGTGPPLMGQREQLGSEALPRNLSVNLNGDPSLSDTTTFNNSEALTTPASATPLLPAFLQDMVGKGGAGCAGYDDGQRCDGNDDDEILSGQLRGISITDGAGGNPVTASSTTPVPGGKYTTPTPGNATTAVASTPGSNRTDNSVIHPRARNNSGSSSTSSSGFSTSDYSSSTRTSSSSVSASTSTSSTSIFSLPLSGSPPVLACTPTNNSNPNRNRNSSTPPNTTKHNCISKGGSSGMVGFYNFNLIGAMGGGGIWTMDGDESRNLAGGGWGAASGPRPPSNGSSSGYLPIGKMGNTTTTTATPMPLAMPIPVSVPLAVGTERKGIV